MPHRIINGARLHIEEHGTGPETILFAHGLLWSGQMFEAQVSALKSSYRCILFDFRGQGRSEVTSGGYDMDTLLADVVALIRALDAGPCHFVGLSMGGFIGLRLAARYPELVRSLTLIGTSADPEPRENVPRYRFLNLVARWLGLGLVADRIMPIMFGQTFLSDPARAEERALWRGRMVANHRVGVTRAVRGVIEREGIFEELERIDVPTLVMVGEDDKATVPAKSERIHRGIRSSRLVVVPRAGHTSTVEEPEAVREALSEFLSGLKDVGPEPPAAEAPRA